MEAAVSVEVLPNDEIESSEKEMKTEELLLVDNTNGPASTLPQRTATMDTTSSPEKAADTRADLLSEGFRPIDIHVGGVSAVELPTEDAVAVVSRVNVQADQSTHEVEPDTEILTSRDIIPSTFSPRIQQSELHHAKSDADNYGIKVVSEMKEKTDGLVLSILPESDISLPEQDVANTTGAASKYATSPGEEENNLIKGVPHPLKVVPESFVEAGSTERKVEQPKPMVLSADKMDKDMSTALSRKKKRAQSFTVGQRENITVVPHPLKVVPETFVEVGSTERKVEQPKPMVLSADKTDDKDASSALSSNKKRIQSFTAGQRENITDGTQQFTHTPTPMSEISQIPKQRNTQKPRSSSRVGKGRRKVAPTSGDTVEGESVLSKAPVQHVFGRKPRPLSAVAKTRKSKNEKRPEVIAPVSTLAFEKAVLQPISPEAGNIDIQDQKTKKRQRRIICCLLVALMMAILAAVAASVAAIIFAQSKDRGDGTLPPCPELTTYTTAEATCPPCPLVTSSCQSVLPDATTTADGSWSEWTDYCACPVSCGGGIQLRRRYCSDKQCPGPTTQSKRCNRNRCRPNRNYRHWATWSEWSICDSTCGNGSQRRSRLCQMPSGSQTADCVGDSAQYRNCNPFSCPATTEAMFVNNSSIANCTVVYTRRVLSNYDYPLSNVIITPSDTPYIVLSVSSVSGDFIINGSCDVENLTLFHSEHLSMEIHDEAIAETQPIVMQKKEALSVVYHPNDKVRFVGENVTLYCETTGTPDADYYEWFKDDIVISVAAGGQSSVLTMKELTVDDSGHYSCRASNAYTTAWSDDAYVDVKENIDKICSASPESHIITLRNDCLYNGSNVIDLSRCSGDLCHMPSEELKSSCNAEANSCCGPVSHIVLDAVCGDGNILPLIIVKECGCVTCPERVILITGTATGIDGSVLSNGNIMSNGTVLATTTSEGDFSFEVPDNTYRLPLLFTDVLQGILVDTVYVAEMMKDTDVLPVTVKMLTHTVNTYSSLDQIQLQLPLQNSYILIPPDSFYLPDGQLYKGTVQISINAIDPFSECLNRFGDCMEAAPGDFSFIDEEGIGQPLETYGMFTLLFSGANDEQLTIPGEVAFGIPATDFQQILTLAAGSPVKLWNLYQVTGRWQEETDFTLHDTKRKSNGNYIAILSGIPHGQRWYSIGIARNSICYSKVRVFENSNFQEYEQIFGSLVSITVRGQGYSTSSTRAKTDVDDSNGYCILHPCAKSGDYVYSGSIIVDMYGHTLYPLDTSPGSLTTYSTSQNKIYFEPAGLPGNSGPLYDVDGTGGKWWTESEACSNAGISERYFTYSKDECYREFNVVEYTQKTMSSCIDQYHLLWYSLESFEELDVLYTVTFVKIYTYGLEHITLNANSQIKNKRTKLNGIGDVYNYFGYRQDCPYDTEVVCLEVKSPTKIGCSLLPPDTLNEDDTIISIWLSEETDDLVISEVNPSLQENNEVLITSGSGKRYFEMVITKELYGSSFGIYRSSHKHLPIARTQAKKRCFSGDTSQDSTTENWMIKINAAYREWTSWGQWTACSVTCGEGTKTRTRVCEAPTNTRTFGCVGDSMQTTQCNDADCPVRLVFALDTSISAMNYKDDAKQFMKDLVSQYKVGFDHTQVALVTSEHDSCRFDQSDSSTTGTIEWRFRNSETSSNDALDDAIDGIDYNGGHCDLTHSTYTLISSNLLDSNYIQSTIVISVADRSGGQISQTLEDAVERVEQNVAIMLAVDVRPGEDNTGYLNMLATSPDHVYSTSQTSEVIQAIKDATS